MQGQDEREKAEQDGLGEELDDEVSFVGPATLRMPTSLARLAERAVLRFMKLTQAIRRMSTAMTEKMYTNWILLLASAHQTYWNGGASVRGRFGTGNDYPLSRGRRPKCGTFPGGPG
jgi:hypothetical protein